MKLFWTLFFVAMTISCVESQERVEDQIMDCLYANYEDGGQAFRQALTDHEADLITENVIEDGSGKSYRAIFQNVVKTGDFSSTPITNSFNERIAELVPLDLQAFQECEDAIKEPNNPNTKRKQLGKVLDSIMSMADMNPSLVANGILSVLEESDFEMDYYKMMIYLTLDNVLDEDLGIARQLPSLEEQAIAEKYDLDNALKIQLKAGEDVFIGGEKVTISELREQVLGYLRKKHTSEPVISISNDRLTSYGTYITVQNEVIAARNTIWDEHAIKRYGKPMSDLTEEIQKELKTQHPIHLIEGVNN